MNGGGESGHVEHAADGSAAAVDVALAAELAAIAAQGSDCGDGGRFRVTQRAEFGEESKEREGGDASDALNLLEAVELELLAGKRALEQRKRTEVLS